MRDWLRHTLKRYGFPSPTEWSVRKLQKRVVAWTPVLAILSTFAEVLERIAPEAALLDRVYRRAIVGSCG